MKTTDNEITLTKDELSNLIESAIEKGVSKGSTAGADKIIEKTESAMAGAGGFILFGSAGLLIGLHVLGGSTLGLVIMGACFLAGLWVL